MLVNKMFSNCKYNNKKQNFTDFEDKKNTVPSNSPVLQPFTPHAKGTRRQHFVNTSHRFGP